LAALCLCAGAAQAAPARTPGDTWESIAKLPDWRGLWQAPFFPETLGWTPIRNEPAPLSAEYLAKAEATRASTTAINDSANCLPSGMPGMMRMPFPIEFLFAPGKVVVITEAYSQYRNIFTDGRKHPEPDALDPTFNGHSIGHWEGDTLVVDTVGIKEATPLGSIGSRFAAVRINHSDQLHIVERIRLATPERLEIETTMTDPKALTKPWTIKAAYERHRDWDLNEYVCAENNQDYDPAASAAGGR
jgi:hypothetical protein